MAIDAVPAPSASDLAAHLSAAAERHQAGDLKTAAAGYEAVLAKAPDHPEALYLSGALDYETGAISDAERKLEHSLAVRPGYLPAIEMLGAVAARNKNFEQAARHFETAAAHKSAEPSAHFRHGHALFFAGAYDKAAVALRRALALKADYTDALYLLATALRIQRRFPEAAESYARLIGFMPTHAVALDEYAAVLFELERIDEAEAMARRAIAAAPNLANPYTNLGRIFQTDYARAEEALALHDQAIARHPDYADAHNNKGVALLTLSRFDNAIDCFRRAIALKPSLAEAHNNLGNALMKINDVVAAGVHYRQAIALRPDYAEAHFNSALLRLVNNDFAGWGEYEWRWQCRDFKCPRRYFPQPQWQGEDLAGGTLLLWGEQGLGDEVLYSSMVDDLSARGLKITLECAPRLLPLMARSFPWVQVIAYSDPANPVTAIPRMQCSTASLGQVLRRDIASFPTQRRGYLRADENRTQEYRRRLLADGKRRVIGISWSSKNPEFGIHKTSRLVSWKAIWEAAGPDTQFVDLQYGDTLTERAAAEAAGMNLVHLPDVDLLNDIDSLASLIAACDIVISVSNTTAHLAGALGIAAWVMVPCGHGQMWYWGAGEMGSPWYPSATVFRQRRLDDWEEVISRISQRLSETSQTQPDPRREDAGQKRHQPALLRAFALHQTGQLSEAADLYRQILHAAPEHFDALHMLGLLYLQTGGYQQAFELIDKAVSIKPAAVVLNSHGNALHALGRNQEALQSYGRALEAKPDYDEAHRNRGDAFQALGRHNEAIDCYTRTLNLNPNHAEAHNNRGISLLALGHAADALADFDRAAALKPGYAAALNNRGDALRTQGRYEEALASYHRSLSIDPTLVDALANSATALQALRRYDDALKTYDKVLAIAPDHIKTLNNRGTVLRDMQRYSDALAGFDQALALKPGYVEALVNRGTVLHELGREEEALASYDAALALNAECPDGHWNKALALLTTGKFAAGWDEFEWRWKCKHFKFTPRDFTQPQWDGAALGPRHGLLVWGEQGIGDEVLYGSMVPDLVDRGFSVTWESDARLIPLIERSYPAVRTVARATPPHALTADPSIHRQISTASLGRYLRPEASCFPARRQGYLKADEDRVRDFRARLLADERTRVIGISWISKNLDFGAHKTSSLTALKPIWTAAGMQTRFVNLQYGDTLAERTESGLDLTHLEDVDTLNDIDGLAALTRACDLVISVSNTTAHLAGALGVPVWVMVPGGMGKLWYWGSGTTGTPWYPTATIFRQAVAGAWDDVVTRIAQKIAGEYEDVPAATSAMHKHPIPPISTAGALT